MVKTSPQNQSRGERGDILEAFRHSGGIKKLRVRMAESDRQADSLQEKRAWLCLSKSLRGLIRGYTVLLSGLTRKSRAWLYLHQVLELLALSTWHQETQSAGTERGWGGIRACRGGDRELTLPPARNHTLFRCLTCYKNRTCQ